MMGFWSVGRDIKGAHIHVVHRQNENNAWSKSQKKWATPVDSVVVQAFDWLRRPPALAHPR
jgi:hypothetical protein